MAFPRAAALGWRAPELAAGMLLLVGDGWAEDHHGVERMDAGGAARARARLPEGAAGVARLQALTGDQLGEDTDAQVRVGIETGRGLWVTALVAAGYQVFGINPRSVARYRDRHGVSGAKAIPPMRTCWRTWYAPAPTSGARSRPTAWARRRSRWWPGRTSPGSGDRTPSAT